MTEMTVAHTTGRAARGQTVRLTAAQALVRYLSVQHSERDGVRRRVIPGIFGIFGHGNVAGLGQALQEHGDRLRFHQPKNEQSAVHAAIGYAKASDRLSTFACTASIGPGSTNLVTGAATATINRLPVLLLASDTFATRLQGPVLQQLEAPYAGDVTVNDALRPVSAFFDRITRPEQLLTALPTAIRVLLDPAATGAVTLALHQDVQGEAYDFPVELFHERTWHVARRPAADTELEAAAEVLRGARRPLLIAGGGVRYSGAQASLAAFAEATGIPVAETSAGKGMAGTGELAVGGLGVNGTRAANDLARAADVIVCVGTRLTDFSTGSHSLFADPEVRFVGVNVAAHDAHKLGAVPVVGDARLVLDALRERLAGRRTGDAFRAEVAERRAAWATELDDDLAPRPGERLSQGQALRVLNAAARAGDVVIGAAGSTPGDLLKLWDSDAGATVHIEFGFSCMGHELPAGLGYRMALGPDAGEVFVVIGDGTYLMANTELATAVQEGQKITLVLFVNGGYQSIHALQEQTTAESLGNEFRLRDQRGALSGDWVGVDYAANIASFGVAVLEADDEASLAGALERARAVSGPVAVVVAVESRRGLLHTGAWWDLGVAQVSELPEVQAIDAARRESARAQRFYG
jgi:3D-(3,5/4)-trihydroxycyclohexane-1,2-dione acylhydrolase (decyclizing)